MGGLAKSLVKVKNIIYNLDTVRYGKTVSDEAEFLERFDRITTAIKSIPYVVGYCYTQVSDVQQEINGLLDEKHGYKLEPEKIREINCREVLPPVCQTAAAVPDNTQ